MAKAAPLEINLTPSTLRSATIDTRLQDCALIAQTYEHGAHYTANEASVFATFNRNLVNMKAINTSIISSLTGYMKGPEEEAKKTTDTAAQMSNPIAEKSKTGAKSSNDNNLQAIDIGASKGVALEGESFGEKLLDWVRDCIPCEQRLLSFIELHPNIDLLGVFENALRMSLQFLAGIADILTNFDIYADFCELMRLLSFICVPDLQRIIALLMALMMLEIPTLDQIIALIQSLIAPLLAPILQAITSLLDQFVLLVTNPLQCVIDALNLQLSKLGFGPLAPTNPLVKASAQLEGGLQQLVKFVEDGKSRIEAKLNFYVAEIKALLNQIGGGDAAYLAMQFRKLQIIRLIAFVIALIEALAKGHTACSPSGKAPEQQELDHFFNNYMNPHGPWNMWVGPDGQIHIDEKVPGYEETVNPPTSTAPLPNMGNVFEFEGTSLVDYSVLARTHAILVEPIRAVIPCRLEVTADDVDLVNKYISELNAA